MAYPAATKTFAKWVEDIDRQALLLKAQAEQQKQLSLASTLDMYSVTRFFDVLVQSNNFFGTASGVTGLTAYLDEQKQGQVPNPTAEFNAMQAAVIATLNWLRTNIPEGTFGGIQYKLVVRWPADNTTPSSPLTVSAAQSAGYRTVLDSLMATIS